MMEQNLVLYAEEHDIASITLNRPERLNILDYRMLTALSSAIRKAKENPFVKAVIITGSGDKSFSAGADIRFFSTASPQEVRELAYLAVSTFGEIESLGKISVAAINGYALGGGLELAEACTFRVAVSHAQLGHPEVRIGAIAGWGGTTRLPRLVGRGYAAELLLTGKMISAEKAMSVGLVNRIAQSSDGLFPETRNLLNEVISQAPLAVQLTGEAIRRGCSLSQDESARLGADFFGILAATEDFREGTQSFVKKVQPLFKGR